MLKILKEETHRLLQNRIFWLTQIAVLIFSVIELIGLFVNGGMSGATVEQRLGSHNYIRFFILPLMFLILEEDMAKGTVPSSGVSRTGFLCGRLMVFGTFLILQIMISYIKDLTAGIFFGGLSFFSLAVFSKMICQWLVLWLMLFAVTVVSFIVFELSSSVLASFFTAIVLPLAVNVVHIICDVEGIFKYIDFIQVKATLSKITFASIGNISSPLLGALAILFAGSFIAVVIFNHLDLQSFQHKRGDFFE